MNILVAVDRRSHSDFVIQEVARLAGNTWADVTLLGVEAEEARDQGAFSSKGKIDESHPLVQAVRKHRTRFLSHFQPEESPYTENMIVEELVEIAPRIWEDLKVCRGARKQLKTRLRPGLPAKAVLAEARQSPCDLIVIGSSTADAQGEFGRSAKKVLREADTSVLVVAESKQPKRIVACLDQEQVSQPSLEMINQMVTLYQADLEIVGVTSSDGGLSHEVDQKMGQILKYYAGNGIKALVRLVKGSSLEAFAEQTARENLMAVWMGRQSRLRRLIPPKNVDRLLTSTDSSLLILR